MEHKETKSEKDMLEQMDKDLLDVFSSTPLPASTQPSSRPGGYPPLFGQTK